MSVDGGRIPALAAERLRLIPSGGAQCVCVVVFGNRDFDDALLELTDLARELSYKVVAATAISASAEHSIIRKYGADRPDKSDMEELISFGKTIQSLMEAGNEM